MCGRYTLWFQEQDLKEIVQSFQPPIKTGEIFPTDIVPIITQQGVLEPARWGIECQGLKKPLINARSETVAEKYMFKRLLQTGRCLVPVTTYYEWNKEKEKFEFFVNSLPMLYLAGLVHQSPNGQNQFVILTRQAMGAIGNIHHRMPVILTSYLQQVWLAGNDYKHILQNSLQETQLDYRKII